MTDDRMDERLREYAGRWTAARPAPAALTPVSRQGSRWVPLAAAAAVVALVAGVTYALGPRTAAPPVSVPSPSVSPSAAPAGPVASYPPCAEDGVYASAGRFVTGSFGLEAWVAFSATGAPCGIDRTPRVELLDGELRDLGVPYLLDGPDAAFVVTATPHRLILRWTGAFCGAPAALTLRVTAGPAAFRFPVHGGRPPCPAGYTDEQRGRLIRQWNETECGAEAWRVVHASAEPMDNRVRVEVVLRNVSLDFCAMNHKPWLRVTAPDGRRPRLSTAVESDMRHAAPLPPDGTVLAAVTWSEYCGEDLGAYRGEIGVGSGWVPFSVAEHPVPPCGEHDPRRDGRVHSEWLTPLTPEYSAR